MSILLEKLLKIVPFEEILTILAQNIKITIENIEKLLI